MNVSKLPLADRILKGAEIIEGSTNNPAVPGNGPTLAAFVTAQDALTEASAAERAARIALTAAISTRDAAMEQWVIALGMLASFTEVATGGSIPGIESTGFDVRAARTPPQQLPPPTNVSVNLNFKPGYSDVSWDRVPGAKSYVIQSSATPEDPKSWKFVVSCTASFMEVNGADPGQRHWYRIAAVNAKGQSPWSEAVSRPVM